MLCCYVPLASLPTCLHLASGTLIFLWLRGTVCSIIAFAVNLLGNNVCSFLICPVIVYVLNTPHHILLLDGTVLVLFAQQHHFAFLDVPTVSLAAWLSTVLLPPYWLGTSFYAGNWGC